LRERELSSEILIAIRNVGQLIRISNKQFGQTGMQDLGETMAFVSGELYAAVRDNESNLVCNNPGEGILSNPDILTRNAADSNARSTWAVESFNDIRIGSSYGIVDLVAMRSTTWTYSRAQRSAIATFVLNQNDPNELGGLSEYFRRSCRNQQESSSGNSQFRWIQRSGSWLGRAAVWKSNTVW
jgi:hypothetical protein